ncbi:MAG: TetR/AcrR family transcriptional regulator [Clostridia bacterium]|nr:TetR/AcrR family transcriptional regulator [Clostridia bacterium]
MSPRERFSRDAITDSAYQIYLESGMNAVTTRAIARKIRGSTQPIFSQFNTIEEVHASVLDRAIRTFCERYQEDFDDEHALLRLSCHLIETVAIRPYLLLTVPLRTMFPSSQPYLEVRERITGHLRKTHHLTRENAEMMLTVILSETIGLLFSAKDSTLENPQQLREYLERLYFSLLKDLQP